MQARTGPTVGLIDRGGPGLLKSGKPLAAGEDTLFATTCSEVRFLALLAGLASVCSSAARASARSSEATRDTRQHPLRVGSTAFSTNLKNSVITAVASVS